MLEVVDHRLSIQEVHCCAQKVPVQRLGEAQTPRSGRDIGNSDDLLEADDLDRSNNDYNVDVAGEHAGEEGRYHNQCPDGSSDEGLALLVIVGCWFVLL